MKPDFIRKHYEHKPAVVIVLGSRDGKFHRRDTCIEKETYSDIPFPGESTVAGHKGKLVFGGEVGVKSGLHGGAFFIIQGYTGPAGCIPHPGDEIPGH